MGLSPFLCLERANAQRHASQVMVGPVEHPRDFLLEGQRGHGRQQFLSFEGVEHLEVHGPVVLRTDGLGMRHAHGYPIGVFEPALEIGVIGEPLLCDMQGLPVVYLQGLFLGRLEVRICLGPSARDNEHDAQQGLVKTGVPVVLSHLGSAPVRIQQPDGPVILPQQGADISERRG
ncbi:MAG: hypothetical protein BWZ01_01918 [Deltaproteobacteria bacterium ADurb.BinA179]|nr:MAG: hypothetical protein BWZ01_01918 [Deltaproteobacteria bacterium ADurb.BinA179]